MIAYDDLAAAFQARHPARSLVIGKIGQRCRQIANVTYGAFYS